MKKLILLLMLAPPVFAGEIKVAAAADLRFALDKIISNFEAKFTGEKVVAVYGASGAFVRQIEAGAPFDLFLSADQKKVEDVMKAGHSTAAPFAYARGELVLWVRNDSKIHLDPKMDCLRRKDIKKVAVANAKVAPYGELAVQALNRAGLLEMLSGKLVVGENVSQAAQFVETSSADVGLISESLALSPALKKEGRFIKIDSSLYLPLVQTGVVLNSPHRAQSERFKDFFLNDESRQVLLSFGLKR